jgi:hypothetical protein
MFNRDTGDIRGYRYFNHGTILDQPIGDDGYIEGTFSHEIYYIGGSPLAPVLKSEFSITQDINIIIIDGSPIEYSTFSNIPEDTIIIFDREDVTDYVDGSPRSISLSNKMPGQYEVKFSNTKYKTKIFTFLVVLE